jgi:hypothetical protein
MAPSDVRQPGYSQADEPLIDHRLWTHVVKWWRRSRLHARQRQTDTYARESLRFLPDRLWTDVEARAAKDQIHVSTAIREALQQYATHGLRYEDYARLAKDRRFCEYVLSDAFLASIPKADGAP